MVEALVWSKFVVAAGLDVSSGKGLISEQKMGEAVQMETKGSREGFERVADYC